MCVRAREVVREKRFAVVGESRARNFFFAWFLCWGVLEVCVLEVCPGVLEVCLGVLGCAWVCSRCGVLAKKSNIIFDECVCVCASVCLGDFGVLV